MDIKTLKPVFLDDINSDTYQLPALLQIVDFHKNQGRPVCENAIAFGDNPNKTHMINLIRQFASDTNIEFVPHAGDSFYYVHPYNPRCYISLDQYFDYLHNCRVAELERIAYDLGAKYAKISFKEEKITLVSKEANAKAHVKFKKDGANAGFDHTKKENRYTEYANAREWHWKGHNEPKRPDLVFYRSEPQIINLIDMRLNDPESVKSTNSTLRSRAKDGIKKQDAIQIDGVLKKLKVEGNASLQSFTEQEARRLLEYHIEF